MSKPTACESETAELNSRVALPVGFGLFSRSCEACNSASYAGLNSPSFIADRPEDTSWISSPVVSDRCMESLARSCDGIMKGQPVACFVAFGLFSRSWQLLLTAMELFAFDANTNAGRISSPVVSDRCMESLARSCDGNRNSSSCINLRCSRSWQLFSTMRAG